jgi:uncharacterized protein (TIGR02677 family)
MADQHLDVFAHLTVPNALLYRSVMGVFTAAKRRFTVHLRPEDVLAAIDGAAGSDDVTKALAALEGWGNLRADPDTSRVTTVEDFRRARYLYQLTRRGEAAEEALETYDRALGRRGSLQAVALSDIATQLRALRALQVPGADPAKVHLALLALVDRFTELAANAQAFMGSLQRSIDLQDADLDAFRAYKDRLIEYLERFIADLVTTGGEIARLIREIEEAGLGQLLDVAAAREAQDAGPGDLDSSDSATAEQDLRETEYRVGQESWRERWAGFRGWFVSEPGHPSQARLLRGRARSAVPALLQVVAALNERRSGRSDRSADFRALALWFAQAPDDASMHRLWRVAFGLHSSRHLTVDADTLADRDADPVPASTPWAQAPSLRISPRLRATGSYERRGKPHEIADRSAQRVHLAELAAREAAETAAARSELACFRPLLLSDAGSLDTGAFKLFLGLLSDALAARTPGAERVETTTADGSLRIVLTGFGTASEAVLHTPEGTFRGPDLLLRIDDLAAWRDEEAIA